MATIAFFGTPEFSLKALAATARFCERNGHKLSMVVTQPDRRQGRGKLLKPPPVKSLALKLGLRVEQPLSLKKNTEDGENFYQAFVQANIDLAVVVAYGKIIPQRLLSAANLHFVNIHASLLPRFRGAAPVQRAIESGDKETGVCLMDMVLKLDEGDVFEQRKTPIIASDNASTLFRRLSNLGACMLYDRLDDLLAGRLRKIPQGEDGAVYASMIEKNEGLLSFTDPGATITNKTRAFDPWPSVFAFIHHKRVQFFDSFFIANAGNAHVEPGTIVALVPFLGVKTRDGIVYFQFMQFEGKKVLPPKEALRGFSLKIGDKIESKLVM